MAGKAGLPAHPVADGNRRLRIAMLGTRGVPASYGGFETAVEEIGRRLVDLGHDVTVYCRPRDAHRRLAPREHLGMRLVNLPALRMKAVETLSHTAVSMLHQLAHKRQDVAFVFNSANAPFVPLIRLHGTPSAVHVDGLEWQRGKWGRMGRRYYRFAEQFAVRWADALISDAQGIADYYRHEFGAPTELLTYGASILTSPGTDRLAELGLKPGEYHLVVARFEPENHADVIVRGYHSSAARHPLVVVGSAPYAAAYTVGIDRVAAADSRIHMLGGVWDQEQLNQLYAHALTYAHGHSVGGTNPSLLRAMGAGTAVLAYDVVFNREVAGPDARYFEDASQLRLLLEQAEAKPLWCAESGRRLQSRAADLYDWDAVALGYEQLAKRLATGYSTRSMRRIRRSDSSWTAQSRQADVSGHDVAVHDVA